MGPRGRLTAAFNDSVCNHATYDDTGSILRERVAVAGKQPVDPVDRARRAAQDCRDATREAHEAIKTFRVTIAELKTLIAEAQQFTPAIVRDELPGAIERQLAARESTMLEMMDSHLGKIIAELKATTSTEDGQEAVKIFKGLPCSHCGFADNGHKPVDGKSTNMRPGDVSICNKCFNPSKVAVGPVVGELILRKPTPVELREINKNPDTRQGLRKIEPATGKRFFPPDYLRTDKSGPR